MKRKPQSKTAARVTGVVVHTREVIEADVALPRPDVVAARVVYVFPTRVHCPRCGSLQTRRYSQDGIVQYRQCQAPICRWRFKIIGETILTK